MLEWKKVNKENCMIKLKEQGNKYCKKQRKTGQELKECVDHISGNAQAQSVP